MKSDQMACTQFAGMLIARHLAGIHAERVPRATIDATGAKCATPRIIGPNIGVCLFRTGDCIAHTNIRAHATTDALVGIQGHCATKSGGRRHSARQPNRGLVADQISGNHLEYLQHPIAPRSGQKRPRPMRVQQRTRPISTSCWLPALTLAEPWMRPAG